MCTYIHTKSRNYPMKMNVDFFHRFFIDLKTPKYRKLNTIALLTRFIVYVLYGIFVTRGKYRYMKWKKKCLHWRWENNTNTSV